MKLKEAKAIDKKQQRAFKYAGKLVKFPTATTDNDLCNRVDQFVDLACEYLIDEGVAPDRPSLKVILKESAKVIREHKKKRNVMTKLEHIIWNIRRWLHDHKRTTKKPEKKMKKGVDRLFDI